MQEKVINVRAPLMPSMESYIKQLEKIWKTQWMTNCGQRYQEFQQKLMLMTDTNVELFVNGHMALDVAIKALNLEGEVITTAFTFASTTHALVMNGLTPVFCDIKEDDYTIDENQIEALITDKTCAIVPVHVYGCICNVDAIEKIAKKHNLFVIYDAAHAFDIKVQGKSVASYGDITMFSFHATKVFNSIEGGALCYDDDSLTKKLCNLRNFGIENAESVTQVGLNAKMNEFAAAMGICNLEILEVAIERRKEIVERYCACINQLEGIKTLDYQQMEERKIEYNYAYMPIEINEEITGYTRNQLHAFFLEHNIVTRKYFYPLVVDLECYINKYGHYELPVSRRVSERILTLPLAASMKDDDIERCCDVLLTMKRG